MERKATNKENNSKGYKSLNIYQKADSFVLLVYKYTRNYPKEELFSLVSQMRRAAVSIVANIVEGWARETLKDKLRFYFISRGSLTEMEYYLDLSYNLKYLSEKQYEELKGLREEVGRLLNGLINSIKNNLVACR